MKWLSGIIMLVLVASLNVWLNWPDGNLRVIACDVGQGDGLLITQGYMQVVIDGGPGREKMSECVGRYVPFWDRSIELVVNTHADRDHYGGLGGVFEDYEVKRLLVPEVMGVTDEYLEWVRQVGESGAEVVEAKAGMMIATGLIKWEVLWPYDEVEGFAWHDVLEGKEEVILGVVSEEKEVETNESSVVLAFDFKGRKGLLTGDIGIETEDILVESGRLEDVDLLKVAHHGSRFSSSEEFLKAVMPEWHLVQVGKNNYGHPHEEALDRIQSVGGEIIRNDEWGDVVLVTDGERWWVE